MACAVVSMTMAWLSSRFFPVGMVKSVIALPATSVGAGMPAAMADTVKSSLASPACTVYVPVNWSAGVALLLKVTSLSVVPVSSVAMSCVPTFMSSLVVTTISIAAPSP